MNHKRKILILSFEFPPCTGGVARYAYEMALEAVKSNCSVTVWTANYGKKHSSFDKELPFKVVRCTTGQYNSKDIPWLLGRILFCRLKEFDLIHAVDWPNIIALSWRNKFLYTPFIATVHGTEIPGLKQSKFARYLWIENPFTHACKVTTNSNFTKRLLIKYFPDIEQDRIQVTHLGVNKDRFRPKSIETTKHVRKQWNIPNENVIITTIARIDKRKGHKIILDALMQTTVEIQRKISYVIVGKAGDNSYLNILRKAARQLESQVIFTGEVSDEEVKEVYTLADIFCMPGVCDGVKVEGFGLSYLEAALYGTPSIGSKLHAVPEVVLDGKTGLLVPPGDEIALVKALEKLIMEPDYLRALGCQAKKHAESFTWERCAGLTYGNLASPDREPL